MNPVQWVERLRQPMECYLTFLYRQVLATDKVPAQQPVLEVDPLAIDLPPKSSTDSYVIRLDIEKRVELAGNQVILGIEGSGKTRLYKRMSNFQRAEALNVAVAASEELDTDHEAAIQKGRFRLLSAERIARVIFHTYWQQRMLNSKNFGLYYRYYRTNPDWRSRMCRFYRRFPPQDYEIPGEHEATAWFKAPAGDTEPKDISSGLVLLRDLIDLVVQPIAVQAAQEAVLPPPTYQHINFWIDGADRLSEKAVQRLLDDLQTLASWEIEHLSVKLFLDGAWESMVRRQEGVRQGRTAMVWMPPWDENTLQALLYQRMKAAAPQLKEGWVGSIPDSCIQYAAKRKLLPQVISKACQVYSRETPVVPDAPIHALLLMQGIFHDLTKRYSEENLGPLSLADLNQMLETYTPGEEEV